MTEYVLTEKEGPLLLVRFNRPEKKNAVTDAMYEGWAAAYEEAERDQDVRAIVLSGEGDSFSAGNDLSTFSTIIEMAAGKLTDPPVLRLIEAGMRSTVPVVAAVEGWCVGIGATMLLHTDLIVAAEGAKFLMPFTKLGAAPEACASRLLPRQLGRQRAAEMLLLSETISAETAHHWGFVNRLTPDGGAFAEAHTIASRIAALPPQSVRATKKLMQEDLETLLPYAQHELEIFAERLQSDEMQEIVAQRLASMKK